MTKRDVAVGFCRAIAWVGMIGAAFGAVRVGLLHWLAGSISLPILAFWQPVLSFGLYLFVWFLARGIGAELVTPREADEIVTAGASLTSLLARGVGLWLFLAAAIQVGPAALVWAYELMRPPAPSMAFPSMAFPSPGYSLRTANLIVEFAQSALGFLLAFTSRIRAFFRS